MSETGEFPREDSSSNGTLIAYTVEARACCNSPKQFGDQIFDEKWRRVVQFKNGEHSVPDRNAKWHPEITNHGEYMTYATAQAMRWWFHAVVDGLCLETRLVKHTIKYSITRTAEEAMDVAGFKP